MPPIGDELASGRSRRGRQASSPRRVRVLRSMEDVDDRTPTRRSRPAYITRTRSASPATTPRSWVIRTSASSRARLQRPQQIQDLRLHGDVERGGRLVGDQRRRGRWRSPSRSSPVGACRPTARAGRSVASRRVGDRHHLEQLDGPRLGLAGRRRVGGRITPRRAGGRSSSTGLSDVIGSWKIIAIRPPRNDAQRAPGAPISSVPSSMHRAGDRGVDGEQAERSPASSRSCRSPTRRRARPLRRAATSRSTPRTACTCPLRRRSGRGGRGCRAAAARRAHSPFALTSKGVAQAVAEEVERQPTVRIAMPGAAAIHHW